MRAHLLFLLAAALLAIPARARAENCVDKEVAAVEGGRPCLDVGSSLMRLEVMQAPGFLDARIGLMRLGLYDLAGGRGTGFELGTWEAIGTWDDLEGVRDLGDRSAATLLTLRHQLDTRDVGVYVGGDLLRHWYGHDRGLTPRVGVRLGRFDHAAVVVEAELPGVYLFGSDGSLRTLVDDHDLRARASMVLSRRWRVEARGRHRALLAADGYRLRDTMLALGLQVEASPRGPGKPSRLDERMRVMTAFAGVAVRRGHVDDTALDGTLARGTASDPWQVMLWLDLDAAIDTDRSVW